MALIKCRDCGKDVSDTAPSCPGCGAPVAKKGGGTIRTGCGCLGAALLVFILVGLFYPTGERNDDTAISACVMAESFVKDRLRAPATADFSSCSDGSAVKAGDTWTVRGYVDSENGFGAKIRSQFLVKMTHQPGNDNWRATQVTID